MNRKLYDLLFYIFSKKDLTADLNELADYFGVYPRTVIDYIKSLNNVLSSDGKEYLEINNSKVICNVNEQEKSEIMNRIGSSNYYDYKLDFAERQFIICLSLLVSTGPQTVAFFENTLLVSKGTITKDLYEVSNFFKNQDIKYESNKSRGFLLDINESKRINCIMKLLSIYEIDGKEIINNEKNSVLVTYFRNVVGFDRFYETIKNAILLAENHFKFYMSEDNYNIIAVILLIIISESSKGRTIEATYKGKTVNNKNATNVSNYILHLIMLSLGPSINDVLFLSNKIDSMILVNQQGELNEKPINFFIVVKSFLYKLSLIYGIDFLVDEKLQEFLTAHIVCVYNRYQKEEYLDNPLKNELMFKYYDDYKVIKDSAYIIEDSLHIVLNENELAYILMHIIAAKERKKKGLLPPNVIVAHDGGFAVSVFLTEQIRNRCNVNIIDVVPYHNIKKYLSKTSCDFVISTKEINITGTKCILTSPLLTGDDISRINDYASSLNSFSKDNEGKNKKELLEIFNKTEKEYTRKNSLRFSDVLHENFIQLNKEVNNWKEAIITAGEPLLLNGYITADYLKAMVDIVDEFGPYIVFAPGVAIAHANQKDGALKNGVSLLKPKNPVKFGNKENDPVKVIIAFSLANTKHYMSVLTDCMNILCKTDSLEELSKAKTKKEVIKIFERY